MEGESAYQTKVGSLGVNDHSSFKVEGGELL